MRPSSLKKSSTEKAIQNISPPNKAPKIRIIMTYTPPYLKITDCGSNKLGFVSMASRLLNQYQSSMAMIAASNGAPTKIPNEINGPKTLICGPVALRARVAIKASSTIRFPKKSLMYFICLILHFIFPFPRELIFHRREAFFYTFSCSSLCI